MKTQDFKIININGRKVEIRLVKKGTTTESFPQTVSPAGAVNNSTELSFRLGAASSTPFEHIVFAHSTTTNLINPLNYVSNGSDYSVVDIDGLKQINANLTLSSTDPNYTTKKIGIFFRVRASDAEYVLADKIGSSTSILYQLVGLPDTSTVSIETFTATRGQYFNDNDYYLPLFLGTLQELKSKWTAQSLGLVPFYSTGAHLVRSAINTTIYVEVAGIEITNPVTSVVRGQPLTITTKVTPSDAGIIEYTYTSSDYDVIDFQDAHSPIATVRGLGDVVISAFARDAVGNLISTNRNFTATSEIAATQFKVSSNTANTVFKFNTESTTQTGKLLIDWGDGSTDSYQDTTTNRSISHTYTNSGIYDIKLTVDGYFSLLAVDPTSTARLTTVASWGGGEINQFTFEDAIGLAVVPNSLPTTITVLDRMFKGCTTFNQNINGWDVSHVESMNRLFDGARAFNQSLNNWNPVKVGDFGYMFKDAISFNQPIDNWNMDALNYMVGMFQGATSFNQTVAHIPVNYVTSLESVFDGASTFNQGLNAWNNKTNRIFSLRNFMRNATSFTSSVGGFDVSNVTTFSGAFSGATSFNDLGLSDWNVATGVSFANMFNGATLFNADLRWWCVSGLVEPENFATGSALSVANQPHWGLCPVKETTVTLTGLASTLMVGSTATLGYTLNPTSPVQSVIYTSSNPAVATISGNVLTVVATGSTTISVTVNGLWVGDQVLTAVPSVTPLRITTTATTNRVVGIAAVDGNPLTVDWGDGNTEVVGSGTQTTHTYTNATAYQMKISVAGANTSMGNVTVFGAINSVDNWYGGQITSLKFYQAGSGIGQTKLTSIPNTQPIFSSTDYSWMFAECDLFNQDISTWNMATATNFEGMFFNATSFNQPIGAWDVSSVTNLQQFLRGASTFNQDLTYWCVTTITEEPAQFADSSALTNANKPVWGTCPNRNVVVTLSADKPTLGEGLKTRLSYSMTPTVTVDTEVWSVDDTAVATVSTRGLVTAKAIGQTNVRVVINGVYKAFLKVTVTALNIDADTMLLKVTDSGVLRVIADQDTLIDWGDGNTEVVLNTTEITHDFTEVGDYFVQISPPNKVANMQLSGNYHQVLQWTSLGYTRLQLGKSGVVTKLVDIPTTQPPLLTNYNSLCAYLADFADDLSQWDVSAVTDFSGMFYSSPKFNSDISEWDVGQATNMDRMLYNASLFDQDLSWWCVTNITTTPTDFAAGSALAANHTPTWGACPVRSYTLTINDADIKVGIQTQLSYVLTPTDAIKTISWVSSNTNALTVNNTGMTTGVAEGSATVTLTINGVYVATKLFTVQTNVVLVAPSNVTVHYVEAPTNLTATLNTST